VARKPDASALAFNPALMTRLPGMHAMAGISLVAPTGEIRWVDNGGVSGSTKAKNAVWPLPHAYFTQQINDRLFWGIGEFTRFGLGVEYPSDWPGRFSVYEICLLSASLNPNIALAVTDSLSVAVGLEPFYGTVDMRKKAPSPLGEFDISIKGADAFTLGFTLSAHYQFNDQWAVGIMYRSKISATIEGDMRFRDVPPPVAAAQNLYDGKTKSKITLPDSITSGIAWTPREDLSIEVAATWTRWSTFKALEFKLPNGYTPPNPKNWKNVWRVGLGVEYDALDWLTLRAGFVRDLSPMTEKHEDYMIPSTSRNIYSLGAGFKWNTWTLDLAYAYIDVKGRGYQSPPGDLMSEARSKDKATNVLSLSVGYTF